MLEEQCAPANAAVQWHVYRQTDWVIVLEEVDRMERALAHASTHVSARGRAAKTPPVPMATDLPHSLMAALA